MKLDLEGGQGALAAPEKGMERMVGLVHTCSNLGASVFTTTCKNPLLASRLETVTENTYDPAAYARREGLDEAAAVLAHDQSSFGALNLVMALLTRLRSMHVTPVITVVLSSLCFFYHLPRRLWDWMCNLRLIMSYWWTARFVRQANEHLIIDRENKSAKMMFACYDNCGYHLKVGHERGDEKNQYFDTVNWYYKFVDAGDAADDAQFETFRPAPRQNPGHLCNPSPQYHRDLLDFCAYYIGSNPWRDILCYPDDPQHPGARSQVVIGTPICGVSTASYQDNCVMLWHLYYHCELDLPDIEHMLVIGDEQTYDRMIKMKAAQPNNYSWLVPFPGEFHLCGHVLHCTYRLWWLHLLQPIRDILRMERIEMDWGMKKFNEHDMFVRTVVCALIKWLEHIFGVGCMEDPAALRRQCYDNFTLIYVLDFLYQDGMPYCTLRQFNRMSPTPGRRFIIDQFYGYYCCRFRATNKFLYAMLCYHYLYIKMNVAEPIWRTWCSNYSFSVCGDPGRNTPADGFMEKINNYGKQLVGGVVNALRVTTVIPLLNFFFRLLERFSVLMGRGGRRWNYLGEPNIDANINTLFNHLTGQIANDVAGATRFDDTNMFTGRSFNQTRHVTTYVRVANQDWVQWCHIRNRAITF